MSENFRTFRVDKLEDGEYYQAVEITVEGHTGIELVPVDINEIMNDLGEQEAEARREAYD